MSTNISKQKREDLLNKIQEIRIKVDEIGNVCFRTSGTSYIRICGNTRENFRFTKN